MATKLDRRGFLRTTLAGVAGSALLSSPVKASLLDSVSPLARSFVAADDEKYWSLVRKQFRFQRGLHYFNNASLGPSPAYVIDAASKFRETLESFPSKYMWGGWRDEIEKVRLKAAELFNAHPDEITLNHNTSEGLSLVASSLKLKPDDEAILSDHAHITCVTPFDYYLGGRGVKLVRPKLPLLPETPEEIFDVYRKAITTKTRIIAISHMVNTNGLILPVKEICDYARERGILTLVDGAQTPGMVKCDMQELGCDFYATSGHKWLMGPKGTGVFYARLDKQPLLIPSMKAKPIKNEAGEGVSKTTTPVICQMYFALGSAIEFHNLLGEAAKEKRIHYLKSYLLQKIAERPFLKLRMPQSQALSAGITSVEMKGKAVVDVANELAKNDISVRPMTMLNINGLRISTSICTTVKEIDLLLDVLDKIPRA